MKKVLHFRLDAPGIYSSNGIEEAFRNLGYSYQGVDWQNLRFSFGITHLREAMISSAKSYQPDIIFMHIQNSEILDEETAMELSKHGFVINYTFDVRSKEKTQWMYDLAPHIGFTFFACWEDVANCAALDIENTGHVHSSCDMSLYRDLDMIRLNDIVFIGNRTTDTNMKFEKAQERVEMVEALADAFGDRFKVYGMGWPYSKLIKPSEEVIIYNSFKVVVCQNQFNRVGYCSDRQWKAMACGAYTLCQDFPGIDVPFPKWDCIDDLIKQCNVALYHQDYRIERAALCHDFVTKSQTWTNRIEEMELIIAKHKKSHAQNTF